MMMVIISVSEDAMVMGFLSRFPFFFAHPAFHLKAQKDKYMPVKYRRFMLLLLVSAAIISTIMSSSFSKKSDDHLIRMTKNSASIQVGAILPAKFMETLPAHPYRPSEAFPVSLHTLKPLADCMAYGVAKWDSKRLTVSVNRINCGKGFQTMKGFLADGKDSTMGIDPKDGQQINIIFTRSIVISR